MKVPLQITFRHVEHSDDVERKIRQRAAKLDSLYDQIMTGRVVVDLPQQRRRKGKIFQVEIDITVPGTELVVNRDPQLNHAHEDVYVAIDDSFDAMERQLTEYARLQRGEVKRDVAAERGRVARLFPEEDYGFIETSDGREIYFHRNAVLDGAFDRLKVGTEVRFSEEQGMEGPQASTVDVS